MEILDVELDEEGHIVIETKEHGLDCFYAFGTKEGDFKGTWLPDGTLKTELLQRKG